VRLTRKERGEMRTERRMRRSGEGREGVSRLFPVLLMLLKGCSNSQAEFEDEGRSKKELAGGGGDWLRPCSSNHQNATSAYSRAPVASYTPPSPPLHLSHAVAVVHHPRPLEQAMKARTPLQRRRMR
jgi:hypothetical protein